MLAKCRSCDAVFSIAEDVGRSEDQVLERALGDFPVPQGEAPAGGGKADAPALPARDPSRPPTPTDHGVQEVAGTDGLTLDVRWFGPQYLFMLVFAAFWNGFLVVWYSIVLGGLANGDAGMAVMGLFPILHVAVGVGIGYSALAGLFNRTRVSVDRKGLSVRHGPLPWPGNVEVDSAQVDQLFLKSRIVRNKNSSSTVYDLKVLDKQGRETTLYKGARDDRAARYLEHRIEGWLGLVDRPVAGEHL